MVTLAVTGGIGSGKSFVSRMLSTMGYPVFDTDSETRRLYSDSTELHTALRAILGDAVFLPDGGVDRSAMAAKVFSDPVLLSEVEKVVYPVLAGHLSAWIEHSRICGTELAVVESALILEKEQFRSMTDRVLTVSAPDEIRVERAIRRDGSDRARVQERMKCQKSDTWREERADYVVINDGRPLLPQLTKIIEDIKSKNTASAVGP